jgi:hypothetical protein
VDGGGERKEGSSHCDTFVPPRPEADVLDFLKSDTNVSDFRTCVGFSAVCRI